MSTNIKQVFQGVKGFGVNSRTEEKTNRPMSEDGYFQNGHIMLFFICTQMQWRDSNWVMIYIIHLKSVIA